MLIHLSYLDFNPRLREGGDALRNSITHQTDLISIHASAKEATFHSLKWRINTTDFNPRLREGGDNGWLYIQTLQRNFNPRLREGGDGIQRHNRLEESKISIHASAKEATCRRIICIFIILFYFNPRLRKGGDTVLQY